MALLPGSPSQRGYISYWIIDPIKTQEVINRLIYRDVETSDYSNLTAGLMFETKRAEDAKVIKTQLEEMGYICSSNVKLTLEKSKKYMKGRL